MCQILYYILNFYDFPTFLERKLKCYGSCSTSICCDRGSKWHRGSISVVPSTLKRYIILIPFSLVSLNKDNQLQSAKYNSYCSWYMICLSFINHLKFSFFKTLLQIFSKFLLPAYSFVNNDCEL